LKKERAAAWIVDTQKHLQEFTGPYLSYYDATIIAGQCARMMARIRSMEVIGNIPKLWAMAASAGILPSQLKMIILPNLEKSGVINILKNGSGGIRKIEEHVPSEENILGIAYDIWESSEAKEVEKISIHSLDLCSTIPKAKDELVHELQDQGYNDKEIALAMELQKGFSILAESDLALPSEPMIYSPYVWGENAPKILKYISHLDEGSRATVKAVLEETSHNQALPLDKLNSFPQDLLTAARKIGLLDVCQVSTRAGVEKGFAFTPRMWGSLGSDKLIPDIYDDVKLFLSSISFGQFYSGISRIKYPVELVEALIQKGKVGPATAIGTDFILMEKHGLVEVKEDPDLGGRYNMYLVKEDVAKTSLEILKHKRLLGLGEQVRIDAKGLCQTGEFVNPEQDKIRLGKLSAASVKAQERLIKVLRREEL